MAILKDLIVHGSSRFLNKIYASEIQTPLIEAEAGIIKKLKADDATVVGLLDVKGQLHTNSWSNSNIATIDGSFYITPTIGSGQGTITITSSTLKFTRKDTNNSFAVESLYLGDNNSITWPSYSKVLVTGQVKLNGEWIPLGTLLGQINGVATAASISINNIKDNKKPPSNTSNVYTALVNSGVNSTDYRNLKISLYQRAAGQTDFRPLGIYMTATGTNGKTFLDIYGGVKFLENNANHGGFAEPNVRIGNLQGLPNVGGQTPNGWGIYTDNGYFKGIIAADQGYIGSGSRYWVIANYEDGSNPNNSRSYIYNNTDSVTSTVEGIYLGTDGIRNYKDSTHYVTIKDGVISALGADLSGKITASSGSIGGWNIGTDTNKSLYYGNQTPGATTTNLVLSPTSATNSNAIGGSATGLNWFLSAGKVFGVTTSGALYATSGKIGGFDIGTTYIKNTKTSYSETTNNGVWVGTDGIGLGKGLFYVTNAGALTAKSGSIAGWSFNTSSLYKTNATPGYNTSTMVISTGTASTNNIGGGGTASKTWMISAGTGFGVTTAGALYCNDAHISGSITATSGTIGGIQLDSNGKLWITDANISGTISGNHIDASSISIGNLNGASNYALKTEITDAEKVATSYITYIDSTEGIKIHNISDQVNYLKLNSSAISMYRNDIETLNISNNEIRIGKFSDNNVFIDNTSVNIREGQNILASFGVDGMQIGLDNETRTEQDYHSWKMVDKDDNVYAFVSDLRDENGEATVTETAKLNEATQWSETNFEISSIISVTVNGEAPESYQKMLDNLIKIQPQPTDEDVVVVTYTSQSPQLKAYTFGKRIQDSNVGGYSFVEGVNNVASGYTSHAEGNSNTSSGEASHVEGMLNTAQGRASHAQNFHTTASSPYQTAIGKYNVDDANNQYAFIIGNGELNRTLHKTDYSNALAIGWNGDMQIGGRMFGTLVEKPEHELPTRTSIPLFKTVSWSGNNSDDWNNVTIAKNTIWSRVGFNIYQKGYRALGVVGFGVYPALTNPANTNWCIITRCYTWYNPNIITEDNHIGADTLDVWVWNQHQSQSAKVRIFARVLYIAESAFAGV